MGSTDPPRFACDAMLGGLARWLRAAGYDATWTYGIEDDFYASWGSFLRHSTIA